MTIRSPTRSYSIIWRCSSAVPLLSLAVRCSCRRSPAATTGSRNWVGPRHIPATVPDWHERRRPCLSELACYDLLPGRVAMPQLEWPKEKRALHVGRTQAWPIPESDAKADCCSAVSAALVSPAYPPQSLAHGL